MKRQSFIYGSAAATTAIPWLARIARADTETLKDAAAAKGVIYGSNFPDVNLITSDDAFQDLVLKQCALIEDGHHFQWRQIHPSPTEFRFSKADAFVNYGRSHNLNVFECHLQWHRGTAPWMAGYINASNWRDVLTNHVKTVVSHFAGKMYGWVVVNEAVNPKDGRPDGLRSANLFVAQGGQEAIDVAFQTAHEADPKAILVYNDYGVEHDKPESEVRRRVMLSMLQGMVKRGVPVHALGIQGHLDADPAGFSAPGLGTFIDQVAALGLKVMITEMDIGDEKLSADVAERDDVAAKMYTGFLNTVLPHKSVVAVIQWSLTDKYSWRNDWKPNGRSKRPDGLPERGLPFGTNLEPTAIFTAILDAFEKAPKR
jgi:endo-1,4-beta-xylanase